jgi:hypothetical protein
MVSLQIIRNFALQNILTDSWQALKQKFGTDILENILQLFQLPYNINRRFFSMWRICDKTENLFGVPFRIALF